MNIKELWNVACNKYGATKTLELVMIFIAAGSLATAIANPLIPNNSKGE